MAHGVYPKSWIRHLSRPLPFVKTLLIAAEPFE